MISVTVRPLRPCILIIVTPTEKMVVIHNMHLYQFNVLLFTLQ